MKILQIDTFGRGGLTHYAYNLSRALAERGHEVTFMTAAGYELEGRAGLPAGLRIVKPIARAGHRLGGSVPGFARAALRKAEAAFDGFAAAARARRLRPGVIHLHCANPIALLHLRSLERLKRPLVATAHVVTPHEPMRFERAIYGRIHRLADLVIAHSEVDRGRLVEEHDVEPGRLTVIPHGEYGFFERDAEPADRASARRDLGLAPQAEVALFFGYIREYKGLDLLLDAWAAVAERRPRARLLVAGDPARLGEARRRELEEQARRLDAVCHFDYVPFGEVARYFAAADLLVMPYRRISQSGVLYLALSLGVPVVATRVGGLPELLRDGESALLVPAEDRAALGDALIRVLGDAELRARLASGGRRIARRHSWPAVAERTAAAFTRLVESQRS